MLILSRKIGEQIMLGDDIVIKVIDISSNRVRLGITAPKSVPVHRAEVSARIQRENQTDEAG